jgi:hypothetical protein
MLSPFARLAAGIALFLALTACTAPVATVVSVTITGGDRTVVAGTSITLTADVQTTGGASTTVIWTSTVETVASITTGGTLNALSPGITIITATSAADPSQSDSITLTVHPPGHLGWTRQFGTSSGDSARGVATDATGNVYAAGDTVGILDGVHAGAEDAFVRSYAKNGDHRWTRQFGTTSFDYARGVATDTKGNVYVAGYTGGSLDGPNAGHSDAFIRSYDADGNHRWTRQFGTIGVDGAYGVATDGNDNVYSVGGTTGALEGVSAGGEDAFIRSYDADGNHRWTRQFGTNGAEVAYGVAADASGNVYAVGFTTGALDGANAGGGDAYIRSYAMDGTLRWTRQFGTGSADSASGVATDANGNVYAAGLTEGALGGAAAGSGDAFIRSYDQDGSHRWTQQFGTSSNDVVEGVATSSNGHVYVGGYTAGTLGDASAGSDDAFIRSHDADGNHRWTRQFGTSSDDYAYGLATDVDGNVYAAGDTSGALDGINAGGFDAFIRRYGP